MGKQDGSALTSPSSIAEKDGKPKMEKTSEKSNDNTSDTDNEKVYPPMKKVLPAMLALYLVFFLIALVGGWPLKPNDTFHLRKD